MRIKILHTALLLCASVAALAQHAPLISQYMQNALPLNPAFTGSRDALSIAGSFRTQWAGFDGAPTTQTLSAHTPLPNESFAVGLLLFNDKIGVTRETGAYANFAYRIKLHRAKLQFGLAAGVSQKSSNWSDVNTDQVGDQVFSADYRNKILPNFSFGTYYYDKDWYASLSVPMFLTHKYGKDGYVAQNIFRNYNILLNTGTRFVMTREWEFRPSIMFRYIHSATLQADINAMFKYEKMFEAGLSLRTDKSFIVLARYMVNQQFSVGYSFDWTFNELSPYHFGTHEFTLIYDFKFVSNSVNPKFF